jgi:hypothetical protein
VSDHLVRVQPAGRGVTEEASGAKATVSGRDPSSGRSPSIPGLAIVFLTSGYVGVRRMRERRVRRT